MIPLPPRSTLFPYTTLFRSALLRRPTGWAPTVEHRGVPGRHHVMPDRGRSEEHTSELQSLTNLVCRLLLEKKKDTSWPRKTFATSQTELTTPNRRPPPQPEV